MTVDTIVRAVVILFACIGMACTLGALAAWASAAAYRRQPRRLLTDERVAELERLYRQVADRAEEENRLMTNRFRPGPFEERR